MSSKEHMMRVLKKGLPGQVGPWLPQETLLLELSHQGTALVKVAATSQDPGLQGSSYQQNTEYWGWGDLSPLAQDIDQLHLRITSASMKPADLDRFLFPNAVALNQTGAQWSTGPYTAPAGLTQYVIAMPDPDLHSRGLGLPLGLVVLVDGQRQLVSVGWFKTFDPPGGWAWKKPLPPGAQQHVVSFAGAIADPKTVGAPLPIPTWAWVLQTLVPT